MDRNSFKDEDKEKFVEFLNFIHKHSTWGRKSDYGSDEQIEFFKLLSYMQQILLPKIDSHTLEVKRVVDTKEESEPKEAEKPKRGRPRKSK